MTQDSQDTVTGTPAPMGLARGAAIALMFFFSGASALVYEVVWSRQLTTLFGASVYAVATVLTAFMGGLALGSWAIGKLADRIRRPLLVFGLFEIGIGAAALAFPTALRLCEPIVGRFYSTGGESTFLTFSLLRFAIAFTLLMIPTTLMGATLPVMSRAVTTGLKGLGHAVGGLYALNTAGAVVGVFSTGFYLLENLGVWHSTVLAVVIDAVVGVAAIALGFSLVVPEGGSAGLLKRDADRSTPAVPRRVLRVVLLTYFLSGLVALACQVAWTRSLLFGFESLKATTYSFTGMLTVFLLGLAIGSAVMQSFVDRLRDPLIIYAGLQFLIGATCCLSVYMILTDLPIFFEEYDLKVSGDLHYWNAIGNVMIRTAAAIGIPTLLMGMCFPVVVRIAVPSWGSLGRDVGRLYAANTCGAIVGSFLGGFALISLFGTTVTIGTLSLFSFGSALAILLVHPSLEGKRRLVSAGLFAAAALIFAGRVLVGDTSRFYHRLVIGETMVYYNEGPLATVSVIEDARDWRTIYVDAIGVAGTDPVLQTDQKSLAHVPMVLLGGDADSVLTVGFGSGGASWSYTLYPDVRHIHGIEIATNVPMAAPSLTDANHGILYPEKNIERWMTERDPSQPPPGGEHPLSMYTHEPAPGFRTFDQRYKLIVDDARAYLRFTDTVYDVIATDCTDLRYKSNANLYDLEYFRLCRERISDRGMVVVWMPLAGLSDEAFRIVVRTFAAVFPQMTVWYFANQPTHYCLFIGARDRLAIDYDKVVNAVELPDIRDDLDEIGLRDPAKLISSFVTDERGLAGWTGEGPLNTEDFPIIEFLSPRYGYDSAPIAENMGNLYSIQVPVHDLIPNDSGPIRGDAERIARFQEANALLFDGHVLYREFEFLDACRRYQEALEIAPDDKSIERLLDLEELTQRLEHDLERGDDISADLWLNGQWLAFSVGKAFEWQGRPEKVVTTAAPFARRLPVPGPDLHPAVIENGKSLNDLLAAAYEQLGNEPRARGFRDEAAEWAKYLPTP